MKYSKRSPTLMNTGIALLFVTFVILCLTVFALLSLSTARADYDLSAKRTNGITEYYNASTKANETVAKVDRILENLVKDEQKNGDGIVTSEEVRNAFTDETEIAVSNSKENPVPKLSFSEKINDNKTIEVTLRLTDASFGTLSVQTADHYYTIEKWQTIVTSDWSADETMNLIDTQKD